MKTKFFLGFAVGAAFMTAIFLITNVGAIVQPPPLVTSVSPVSGSTIGGETVVMTGDYLNDVSVVKMDSTVVTVQTKTSDSIVIVTPAHVPGFVDITLESLQGNVVMANAYEFLSPPPPVITSLSPSQGSIDGGVAITLFGHSLSGVNSVYFDGIPAIIESVSENQISVIPPAHTEGWVRIEVRADSGLFSMDEAYEYIDDNPPPPPVIPSVESFNPHMGPTDGNTLITVNGLNLQSIQSILFGGIIVDLLSQTESEITFLTPSHVAGTIDITFVYQEGLVQFNAGYTYTESTKPPAYDFCDWDNNGNHRKKSKFNFKNKAFVCHNESRSKTKTLCLPIEAIVAHVAHGDELGECELEDSKGGKKDDDKKGEDKYDKKDDDKYENKKGVKDDDKKGEDKYEKKENDKSKNKK